MQEKQEEEELKRRQKQDSFYQKLADGFGVNVLIVGDSIGEGGGIQTEGKQWFRSLQSYLQTKTQGTVTVTNVSMGGNTSYAGYVRTMALQDDKEYDLAVICYGQNDAPEGFDVNYEAMICAIRSKYSDCSLISVLESSQRRYTQKMKEIQSICDHYEIPVADTIAAFKESGKPYKTLTEDGIHPNDAGQDIYFDTVRDVIEEQVKASAGKMKSVKSINASVHRYDHFKWYGVDDAFTRTNDTTFTLETQASGIFGIDYTFESGDNKADIYVDGKLYKSPTVTFDYDFSQRHIMVVDDDCKVKRKIKVVFGTKEQADGFQGVCFSWK